MLLYLYKSLLMCDLRIKPFRLRQDLRAARRGTDRLGDPALPVPLVRTAGSEMWPCPVRPAKTAASETQWVAELAYHHEISRSSLFANQTLKR